jgi:hypothetical protein
MPYTKKAINDSGREALIQMVIELQEKLTKRNTELHQTRTKLRTARSRMVKMKDTVEFQRNRILELLSGVGM